MVDWLTMQNANRLGFDGLAQIKPEKILTNAALLKTKAVIEGKGEKSDEKWKRLGDAVARTRSGISSRLLENLSVSPEKRLHELIDKILGQLGLDDNDIGGLVLSHTTPGAQESDPIAKQVASERFKDSEFGYHGFAPGCVGSAKIVEEVLKNRQKIEKGKHILVAAIEFPSRYVTPTGDFRLLFGDGSVIGSISEDGQHKIIKAQTERRQVEFGKDTKLFWHEHLENVQDLHGREHERLHSVGMNGGLVGQHAGQLMLDTVVSEHKATGSSDRKIIIPHPANGLMIKHMEEQTRAMGHTGLEYVTNIETRGNSESAGLLINLCEWMDENAAKVGEVGRGIYVIGPSAGVAHSLEDAPNHAKDQKSVDFGCITLEAQAR